MNPNSLSSPGMDWARIPEYVMNTLCRICAKKATNLIPIFKDEFLPQKILKCLPIKISASDDLPRNVCESCFQRIDQSYSLYETAHKSNGKLKKLWRILLKETFHQSSITCLPENINKDENKKEADSNPEDLLIVGKTIVLEIVNSNNGNDSSNRDESKLKDKKEKEVKLENSLQFIPAESKEDFKTSEKEDESKSKSDIRVYQCQFCFRQLTTPASLSIHESTHSQHRPFLCDTCGKSFKHANNLRCHTRTHLIIKKKHTCIICNKEFLTKFFLQEHMNSHTGETPYKCDTCKKEFREKVHLRQHKWSHSLEKFTCPICGSKFNRKGNMKEHIKKFHKSHSEQKALCEFKPFENSSSNEMSPKLNIRGQVEEKRFSCLLCGKKFRHSGSLTYHRRTAHTGEKPFQCSYCNQKFSLRSVQKIHERKTHTFERPYRCSVCSRMFTNSSSLRNHLFIHSKQKMFECKECGKKFTRSSNLSVHMKIHTGDRQFACDQCGKTYIQKHDLLKHIKMHDPKSKPFFCKYCGNSFSNKKDSAKHSTCQFDSLRKFHSEGFTAEKILESVSANFHPEDVEEFLHQEDIIMASMEEISRENIIT